MDKAAILSKVAALRADCPSGATAVFAPFASAVGGYFNRGAAFEELMRDAFLNVSEDAYFIGFKAEHPEVMPAPSGSGQLGFDNIMEIFFQTEVFESIVATAVSVVRAAYRSTGMPPEIRYENAILEGWTATVNATLMRETMAVNELIEYCENRWASWTALPPRVDELGDTWNIYKADESRLREDVYNGRGWSELESTFGIRLDA